jgi:hypothetical protein
MAERKIQKKFLYEGAAARYRALMVKSSDPARRRMLAEMIARELELRREFFAPAMTGKRSGNAGTA